MRFARTLVVVRWSRSAAGLAARHSTALDCDFGLRSVLPASLRALPLPASFSRAFPAAPGLGRVPRQEILLRLEVPQRARVVLLPFSLFWRGCPANIPFRCASPAKTA